MRLLSIRPWCQLAPIQAEWFPKMGWKHKHTCDHTSNSRQSYMTIPNSNPNRQFRVPAMLWWNWRRPEGRWATHMEVPDDTHHMLQCGHDQKYTILQTGWQVQLVKIRITRPWFFLLGSHHTEVSYTALLIAKSVEYVPSLPRHRWTQLNDSSSSKLCHFIFWEALASLTSLAY